MHALIHNQLQAPIYRNVIKYARYAAELITQQTFLQCKSSYIPDWSKNCKMSASSKYLLDVSGEANLCFCCICDEYHPEFCKPNLYYSDNVKSFTDVKYWRIFSTSHWETNCTHLILKCERTKKEKKIMQRLWKEN
jgi:hypothetical protein